jgi:hypothetical protein
VMACFAIDAPAPSAQRCAESLRKMTMRSLDKANGS